MNMPVKQNDSQSGIISTCLSTPAYFLILDTAALLNDCCTDSYLRHHAACEDVLTASHANFLYLTLIGGEEPLAKNDHLAFLSEHRIHVLTVNALWCLCCRYLANSKLGAWDLLLPEFFSDSNCIGLTSMGKLMYPNY